MNQLFRGMHAIHGMGNVCKESLKEFEEVVPPNFISHGYQKGTARSDDILWDISKAVDNWPWI